MEFRNLTPFSTLSYKMLDIENRPFHVVTMKVGYRLKSLSKGLYHAEILDDAPLPLCFEDQFNGKINLTSVREESDLAPLKPLCDVIVKGIAYAPHKTPSAAFPVQLKISAATGEILLDKSLMIFGKRKMIKGLFGSWTLSEAEPLSQLPLDYQFAYGGDCCIHQQDTGADKIPQSYQLTEDQRAAHPDKALPEFKNNPVIAHSINEANPLGLGFIESWYAKYHEIEDYAMPQIEHPDHPLDAIKFKALIKDQAHINDPCYQPHGFGFIGRAWLPRRLKAGTYDDEWVKNRHPYLPFDFDFNYWNAAPADQQIPYPKPGFQIELQHLNQQGLMKVQLPHSSASLLLRMNDGNFIPVLMNLDTLIIDTQKEILSLTYRYLLSCEAPVRIIEARFSGDVHQDHINIELNSDDHSTKKEITSG